MRKILYWSAAPFLCALLYWPGPDAWFHLDDFVWLGLTTELRELSDLGSILFQPMAQGTIRPLSERAFFLVLYGLAGLNPWPFWILIFITQFANLVLLTSIGRRLTGSAVVGLLAALLWSANDALAVPLAWISAYNQVLVTFFLLLSFWFLLQYVRHERPMDWYAQWISFLLGFGALELNVIYPALATGYCLCCARKHVPRTLQLWVASVIFTVAHFLVAPEREGAYALHFDTSLVETFARYSAWVLGPPQFALVYALPGW